MLLRRFFAAVTRLSLRFKWITIALSIAFLVLGVASALDLKPDLLPSVEFPQTFIITFRPGASSEDLRDLVTIPLEDELAKIPNVLPEGLESTTVSPVAFVIARNDYVPNQQAVRDAIQAAIDRVIADGVPAGLETTASLTPEIMTKVLSKAPSMFKHFKAEHLRAMSPEVLQAALLASPDLIKEIDFVTLDALATDRLASTLIGVTAEHAPVELPSAWRVGQPDAQGNPGGQPRIITFSLNSLPILTASVSSSTRSVAELREFVNENIRDKLTADVAGVGNVSVVGGETVPQDVYDAALVAVAEARKAESENAGGSSSDPVTPPPSTNPRQLSAPALPGAWRQIGIPPLLVNNPLANQLKVRFETTAKFDTADDLLSATDGKGEKLAASALLNQIAELNPQSAELQTLTAEILNYVRERETGFTAALSEPALRLIGTASLRSGAWATLLGQESVRALVVVTLDDLKKIGGAETITAVLNNIIANTPAEFEVFAVRLIDGLTPEAWAYLGKVEPGFAGKLGTAVWRVMSAQALDFLRADIPAELSTKLTPIADGAAPSAAARLAQPGAEVVDDPNAPAMPESWVKALGSFGFKVETANDLYKPPFAGPAAFFNQSAANPGAGNLMKEIPASLLLYLEARTPGFFEALNDATVSMFSEETLQALPNSVRARASSGPAFTPVANVTRTNGSPSLLVSITKNADANTVVVFHEVDDYFKKLLADNPDLTISTVFEQASFIEESIGGVVREGGLGGVMAVIVILVFLNFSIRSTVVTAVSIPTSLAIAFVAMRFIPGVMNDWLTDPATIAAVPTTLHTFLLRLFPPSITLNIMTLSGLTVAIGRVVDDSIVVLENIYRQLQHGMDRQEAVIKGTRDVSMAIFAATLTTIVVFLPIGLTGGLVGEFFLPFGLAVTYALAASFVVAITVIPVLTYLFVPPDRLPEEKEGRLERVYHTGIDWALKHRFLMLALAGVTFVIGMVIFAGRPTTFLPELGEPQLSIAVEMPSGTAVGETDVRMREMEAYLETLIQEHKGITRYQTNIGSGSGFSDLASLLGGGGTVNGAVGSISAAVEVRGEALDDLTRQVRDKAGEIFGVNNVAVSSGTLSSQGFGGFEVVTSGPEADLRSINDRVIETLAAVPGLTNITSTLDLVGGDTISYLRVNRTAAAKYAAELEATDTLGVTRTAITAVKAIPGLPDTVTVGEGFQSQQQTEGFTQTFSAIGVSVLAVYVVMVFTFGSLVHPFTILFTLPLAVVGAAVGLWVTNRVVGISALVGLLMLVGIVVTNAIVMIDRVQQNRKEKGMPVNEALSKGAVTRLRPILMTAIATMFALLPLAIGLSEGAIIASELGTVVIGGLFSSTFLTLLVIPVVYSLIEGSMARLFGRGKKG